MSERRARRQSGTFFVTICGLVAASAFAAPAGPRPVKPAGIVVEDVHARSVRPLAGKARKGTLLVFIAHDCPISNTYAPEVGRICKEYARRGIAPYIVYTEREITAKDARKHAADYSYPCPALLDPQRKLVRYTGARMTPEAVLLSAGAKVIYRGRIDDTYIDFGKRRDAPTTHDLRNAIDALLANKPVSPAKTTVVGCWIPDL